MGGLKNKKNIEWVYCMKKIVWFVEYVYFVMCLSGCVSRVMVIKLFFVFGWCCYFVVMWNKCGVIFIFFWLFLSFKVGS